MKKWYQSKIVITNIISCILGIIPLIDERILTTVGIMNVQGYLSILGLVTTVLNLFLRVISGGQVISSKKQIM